MKYRKFLARMKRENLKIPDVARDLGVCEKELRLKLKGKKPLYIHEAERLFALLGVECGKEKIKFF